MCLFAPSRTEADYIASTAGDQRHVSHCNCRSALLPLGGPFEVEEMKMQIHPGPKMPNNQLAWPKCLNAR